MEIRTGSIPVIAYVPIAQLVERRSYEPKVEGSSPSGNIFFFIFSFYKNDFFSLLSIIYIHLSYLYYLSQFTTMSSPSIHLSSDDVPRDFKCPITYDIYVNPVILTCSGKTYEEYAIKEWLKRDSTCPLTKIAFDHKKHSLIKNTLLKQKIHDFVKTSKKIKKIFLDNKKSIEDIIERKKNITWQWCVDYKNNIWYSYDKETKNRLEIAYNKNKTVLSLNAKYMVHLDSMYQCDNEQPHRRRDVRRVEGYIPIESDKNKGKWYFESKITNIQSKYKLENYTPVSLYDNNILEKEYKKPVHERTSVIIGPNINLVADVSKMTQIGIMNTRKLIRLI